MNLSSGKIWPYAISASIALIVCAGIATVVIAVEAPVEKSDIYMMDYHEADDKANEIIEDTITFNKKYRVEYISDGLKKDSAVIKYRVVDMDSNPVNNAKFKVIITRPTTTKQDHKMAEPTVENGVYTFKPISLEEAGRWDIMAKINIDGIQKFYNLKADTRNSEVVEY
ncbi:FixH family protein [Sulfurimonas sp.]|uniref:FixH family protein n=1 Tax=Sulfurimonas sp. TaxID=2022749 RepID=UPI0025DDEDC1|nr:FixH family protein [Sulfurimonas sp.]MDD5157579.1 FixH family protein [Sulfurimonas sp.]